MASLIDSNSRFAINPTNINIQSAKFDMSSTVKTSFNVGYLVHFDVIEVLPGDTFDLETNILCRLQTLLTPIMDNLYLDTYYFFVPARLVWEHWKEFCGENTQSAWYPETQYQIPVINFPSESGGTGNTGNGTVLDYMGVPTNNSYTSLPSVNALPVRAYCLIWNEWFRDQNLQDPLLVPLDDSAVQYSATDSTKGGVLLKANKYHDYFTSALPAPQKGPDVTIPLSGNVPVNTGAVHDVSSAAAYPLFFTGTNGPLDTGYSGVPIRLGSVGGNMSTKIDTKDTMGPGDSSYIRPSNLWAELSNLPMVTINQLRLAFATQRLYEKDARGGTRYTEILRSHFGVTSPDARLQRPELLAYNHIPINITQIVQNSETGTTPQGSTTAMSMTASHDGSFKKSFTEHGYILGLAVARYKHTYQQGLHKMWSRRSRFDFYWPVFSNIGEQPILNKEIYVDGSVAAGASDNVNDEVFGYQEAWAEYRYRPDRTSAEMRSSHPTPLDSWHLGDVYDTTPALSDEWIQEDKSQVDRVLAVTSENANQLFMDIYIKLYATRPMPMYSIPGLIDHF